MRSAGVPRSCCSSGLAASRATTELVVAAHGAGRARLRRDRPGGGCMSVRRRPPARSSVWRGAVRPRARPRRQPRRPPGRGPVQRRPHDRPARAARGVSRTPVDRWLRAATARASSKADGVALDCAVATDAPDDARARPAGRCGRRPVPLLRARDLRAGAHGRGRRGRAPFSRSARSTWAPSAWCSSRWPRASSRSSARLPDDTLVALDPNCRPTHDRRPRRLPRAARTAAARTDVMKVSEEDLAWLDPGTDRADAARALLGHADGAWPSSRSAGTAHWWSPPARPRRSPPRSSR